MGGSTTTVQQGSSQSINEIPQWVQNAGQANYGLAQQVASQPLQQYQGQMVADVAPQTQQAWNLAANSGNVGVGAQNAAQAGYLNTLAQTPAQIAAAQGTLSQGATAQTKAAPTVTAAQAATAAPTVAQQAALSTLNGMNLQGYMNPYTQSVIDKTLPIMDQSLAQQQNALQNQANTANAFGGSRQGITQGVLGAQGALSEAQMAAQLNQANYAQAQAAGEFDVGQANQMGEFNANQMNTVGMYNQGQANQANQFNANQTNQVGMYNEGQLNQVGMSNTQQANAMNQFNAGQANNMSQFNAGAQNTAAYENQMAGLQQEQLNNTASQGLGLLGQQQEQNNIANFGMLTAAGGQEQQQAQNEINAQMAKFQQAYSYPQQQLGMMESSLGMTPYNSGTSGTSASTSTQSQSNPMAAALSGLQAASGVFGFLSDRRMKTDIVKVGKHATGLDMYSYRYKGDPKTYPKVVGPMAEDVAKIAPHAVMPMTTKGHLAIHMPTLNALSTPPSSPGVAKAIGMLGSSSTPGRLSPNATPPSRGILGALGKGHSHVPIKGALSAA